MTTTPNFGLQILPANATPEEIEQYTNGDRILIDSVLYQGASAHRHDGAAVGSPAAPDPGEVSLALYPAEGYLAAGRLYWYRWTRVSAAGIETMPSAPVSVATPGPLDVPEAPTVAYLDTGGDCYPGAWAYAVTAYQGYFTADTTAARTVVANLEFGPGIDPLITQQVVLTLPAVPSGATGLNIYRQIPGSTLMQYLASVPAVDCGDPFFDTGGPSPIPERTLSNKDTSALGAKVRLTPTVPVPAGEKLRFYRQLGSNGGLWSQTFVGEMDDADVDGFFEDLGGPTTSGTPPTRSFGFNNPPKIVLPDETEGNLPVARLAGKVPHAQIQSHACSQTWRSDVSTGNPVGADWVTPFTAIRPAVLGISVPLGSEPTTANLTVELQLYDGGWLPLVTAVVLVGDAGGGITIDPADLITAVGLAEFPAGTRFRALVTEAGSALEASVHLAFAAKLDMDPFTWTGD